MAIMYVTQVMPQKICRIDISGVYSLYSVGVNLPLKSF